jgi:uncharacterized protein (TIRG00374 family)
MNQRNSRRFLLGSALLALIMYGAAIAVAEPLDIWGAVSAVRGHAWLACLVILLTSFALRFLRWQRYLHVFGHHVKASKSLSYYIAGFAFTTTPAKAGEAMRSLYLKSEGVPYTNSLAAFFSERFVDVIALILLATTAALEYETARWPVVAMAIAAVIALPLIHHARVHRIIKDWAQRPGQQKLRISVGHFVRLLESSSQLLRGSALFEGLGLAFLAWAAEGLILYVILVALQVDISALVVISIWATSMLAGAASFLPGGLGSTEAVMTGLLVLVGVDGSIAIAATVAYRIASLWLAVALGFVFVTVIESSRQVSSGNSEGGDNDKDPNRDRPK